MIQATLRGRRRCGGLHRVNHPAETRVRPDHRSLRMAPEQVFHLREVDRLGAFLRERNIDVVVQEDDEPHLTREFEDAVERRVREARGVAGDLGRDELLVNRELADAGEHAGERLEHAANVVGGVHVGGIEAGDHRIEARLITPRQRLVLRRDVGVGEGVIVERRVGLQIVRRRVVTGVLVRPRLLERDPEDRDAAGLVAHRLQELLHRRPLLHVVRQVKVGVVERVVRSAGRGCGTNQRGPKPSQRTRCAVLVTWNAPSEISSRFE